MEPSPRHAVRFLETAKRLARQLLAIGEKRFGLLLVELQEERERLLHAILLGLGVAAFGLLAGVGLTAAIAVLFWKLSPLVALWALTFLYKDGRTLPLLAAQPIVVSVADSSRGRRSTPKRPRMLGNTSHATLELRKQLLIMESELNRARLSQVCGAMSEGVRRVARRVQSVVSWISLSALLASGLFFFQHKQQIVSTEVKSSRFGRAVKPTRLASSTLLALYSGFGRRQH